MEEDLFHLVRVGGMSIFSRKTHQWEEGRRKSEVISWNNKGSQYASLLLYKVCQCVCPIYTYILQRQKHIFRNIRTILIKKTSAGISKT